MKNSVVEKNKRYLALKGEISLVYNLQTYRGLKGREREFDAQ